MHNCTPTGFSIHDLNGAPVADATQMLEQVLERAPWLAGRVAAARPFADAQRLADHIGTEIAALSRDETLTLLQAHPELAPASPTSMTLASQSEQGRLDLAQPDDDLAAQLSDLNRRYRLRHGFPFIVALHAKKDIASVFAQFLSSLDQDTATEITRARGEVVSVARARLARVVVSDPVAAPKAGI
jgi:OHCU decarboxylase